MEAFFETIIQIFEIIKENYDYLRHGKYSSVVSKSNKIIEPQLAIFGKEFRIVFTHNFGINIEFEGLTSFFLFPATLYVNPFRKKIINDLVVLIQKKCPKEDFIKILSSKLFKTTGYKNGGFNKSSLEFLRFFLKNYTKILDDKMELYLPLLKNYDSKFQKLTIRTVRKKFPLINKYNFFQYIPNCQNFLLPAIIVDYEKESDYLKSTGNLLGLLYDDTLEKKFNLLFISNLEIKKFKKQLIYQISFFENFDLYYENKKFHKLRNSVGNIWNEYSDYKDSKFLDSSIDYNINYLSTRRKDPNEDIDKESLIHIFNTRKIRSDYHIHPVLKKYIGYRNKIIALYSSITYHIYIYDSQGKDISRIRKIFDILFKNIFSNGFIVHYYSGFLISTNAFRVDFEKEKKNLLEFIWSFKLEIKIYENLNYIPFSFYRLPNSSYYSNETNTWEFPNFEEKPVKEYYNHLLINSQKEEKRSKDIHFKERVEITVQNYLSDMKELKKKKGKKPNNNSI